MEMKRIIIVLSISLLPFFSIAQEGLPGINEYIFAEEPATPLNLPEVSQLIGYPESAQKAGIEGQVIARVLVDKEGNYLQHKIVREIDTALASAVEQHVSKLTFKPAKHGGKAIIFWVNIPFSFKLQTIDPLQKAINDFTAYIEQNPESYEAYMQRGVSYMELQDFDKAISDLDQSISLNPKMNKNKAENNSYGFLYYALYAKGKAQASKNMWEQSINTLNEALKISEEIKIKDSTVTSTLPSLYADRGFAYINLDQPEKAIADYDLSISMDKNIACTVHQLRAEACLAMNDFAKVLTSYDAMIECQPNDKFLHYSRGFYRMETQDYDGAVADFQEAVNRNTDSNIKIAALNSSSLAYLKSGKPTEAIAEVEKGININILNASSYYYRGKIYQETGDKAKACKDYQTALDYGLEDSMPDEAKEVESFISASCN